MASVANVASVASALNTLLENSDNAAAPEKIYRILLAPFDLLINFHQYIFFVILNGKIFIRIGCFKILFSFQLNMMHVMPHQPVLVAKGFK